LELKTQQGTLIKGTPGFGLHMTFKTSAQPFTMCSLMLPEITGWVNGNYYVPTTETLGILPIPLEIRESSGMASYVSGPISNIKTGEKKKRQRHDFLAQMQGTRKPVLPIHTNAEKLMFRTLMKNREFNPPNVSEPPWNRSSEDLECICG
jgi:hypothetical protein